VPRAGRLHCPFPRLLGETAGREHARHAQRPLGLAAQFGCARLRIETRIGGGRKVRRLVQHAGLTFRQGNHAALSKPPHGEPSRPVDHLYDKPDLVRPFVPIHLRRKRFAIEIEHGQYARATVAARASLDEQRPFAMATSHFIGDGFFRRQDARRDTCLHHRLHALDHGRPTGRHFECAEIALSVEYAVGKRLLVTEKVQNLVLDRIFANEIDDGHRTRLVLAPSAGNTLFKLCRIPRQVDVDDGARGLQIEPDAPAVG
jgi:hypothetical protein